MKTLTLDHLDLSDNPNTYVNSDYSSGTTLTVANSSGFAANDYIVIGKMGDTEKCEIVQISSITNATTIVLTGALDFDYTAGTTVVQIPYNQFRVYRSATGVGGSYTLLVTQDIQVDKEINTYQDTTTSTVVSWKLCFYNSTTTDASDYTDEIPYAGFPLWSVVGIQDSVTTLFRGDSKDSFITREIILTWINECVNTLQFMITDGESPYYVNSATITSTNADTYDLSDEAPLGVFMVEISKDGGLTYPYRMTPKDFRNRDSGGSVDDYDYRLAGMTLHVNPKVPTGDIIRVWFSDNPTQLADQSDVLPDPFKAHSAMIVNYCLMRAHEKDRKFMEIATYYRRIWEKDIERPDSIIYKIKSRLSQGNKAIASTYSDDYDSGAVY